jgi:hypothetical protein
MNARHLLAAPLVAAAVAGPYLSEQKDLEQPVAAQGAAGDADLPPIVLPTSLAPEPPAALPIPSSPDAPAATSAADALPPFDASRASIAGVPAADFAEILRFDITPEWLFTRWSRVSTVTADQSLKGFRVAMVTGSRVDDIAGVATYYFGRHGLMQRLTFEGRTGDTRRLTAFLTQNYGFKAEPTLGAGMYLVRWNAKPMSAMRVDYAPVVRADAPHERYTLKLEINRPDESYQMSDEFRHILGEDQETKRWLPF